MNACIEGAVPTFSCPWNNSDPTRPADYIGEVPRQVCQVCGVKAELKDEDIREGWFSGLVSFGAAEHGGVVDEAQVSEYRIYIVNASGSRLGDPVAKLPKRAESVPGECCSGDTYQARVEVSLLEDRAAFDKFMIFLVVDGVELPGGAPTPAIVDLKPGQCQAADCPAGFALKAAGLQCQSAACDLPSECCVPLGTCADLDCSSLGPDFIQKINLPTNCSGESCDQLECCELSEFVATFDTPSTGQASSAAAVGVLVVLGLCVCCFLAATRVFGCGFCGFGSSKSNSSLSQIVPARAGDYSADPFGLDDFSLPPLEEDVEAAVAAEGKRRKEAEERRKEAEAAGFIKRTVGVFRRFVGPKQEEDCLGLLLGLAQTLMEHPDDPQFRSLDLQNDILASRVFSVQGTVDLLEAAGFRKDRKTSCLVLRTDAPLRPVQLVQEALEARLNELWEQRIENDIPAMFPKVAEQEASAVVVEKPPLSPEACAAAVGNEAAEGTSDMNGVAAGSNADTTDGAELPHEQP